jgi:hypothetical protein
MLQAAHQKISDTPLARSHTTDPTGPPITLDQDPVPTRRALRAAYDWQTALAA